MQAEKYRRNNLGVAGWVWAGNYKVERYLYTLHRITGLGLMLYGLFHIIVTTVFRVQGEAVWNAAMAFLDSPAFKVGEFLVLIAFAFHALNGLRLILQELGFTLGRPTPPVYPYSDALRRRRFLTMVFMAVVMLLVSAFFFNSAAGGWK